MTAFDLSLYLVTDRTLCHNRSLETIVREAVEGGVTMVQLREKYASSKEFYEIANRIKKVLQPHRVPLIINDRLDIAIACDADGLHIGQNDLPYEVARKILGKEKIIGLSVENIRDAIDANSLDVDYIGISPVFGTPTKTDTALPLGLEGVKTIAEISKHPTVGIGGLNIHNSKEVMDAGADGIAVVSAIMSANHPGNAASELINLIKKKQI